MGAGGPYWVERPLRWGADAAVVDLTSATSRQRGRTDVFRSGLDPCDTGSARLPDLVEDVQIRPSSRSSPHQREASSKAVTPSGWTASRASRPPSLEWATPPGTDPGSGRPPSRECALASARARHRRQGLLQCGFPCLADLTITAGASEGSHPARGTKRLVGYGSPREPSLARTRLPPVRQRDSVLRNPWNGCDSGLRADSVHRLHGGTLL